MDFAPGHAAELMGLLESTSKRARRSSPRSLSWRKELSAEGLVTWSLETHQKPATSGLCFILHEPRFDQSSATFRGFLHTSSVVPRQTVARPLLAESRCCCAEAQGVDLL